MQNTELILAILTLMTTGGGLASVYSLFVRMRSGKKIDDKLNEIDIKQNQQLEELKKGQLEQRRQIENIIDFNNNAAYIIELKLIIMECFNDFLSSNKIRNKEFIQFLDFLQEGFERFSKNIVQTKWTVNFIKLDKSWESFYNQAKRSITLCKLGIKEKNQDAFKNEIDKIVLENYPKNYFNEIIRICNLNNGERKEKFQEISENIIKELILDFFSVIKKYS